MTSLSRFIAVAGLLVALGGCSTMDLAPAGQDLRLSRPKKPPHAPTTAGELADNYDALVRSVKQDNRKKCTVLAAASKPCK